MTPEVKYRDAVSGEYVTREYALANPATTVAEIDDLEDEGTEGDDTGEHDIFAEDE